MEHIEFLNPNNRYKCLKCGDEFENSNGIKHHNSDLHRKWHHVCSKCYNAFARKINLLEHRSKNIHGINVADEEEKEEAEEEDDEGGNEVEDDDGNEGGNEVEVEAEDDSGVDEGGENAEHGDEEEADGGENGEDGDGNEVG